MAENGLRYYIGKGAQYATDAANKVGKTAKGLGAPLSGVGTVAKQLPVVGAAYETGKAFQSAFAGDRQGTAKHLGLAALNMIPGAKQAKSLAFANPALPALLQPLKQRAVPLVERALSSPWGRRIAGGVGLTGTALDAAADITGLAAPAEAASSTPIAGEQQQPQLDPGASRVLRGGFDDTERLTGLRRGGLPNVDMSPLQGRAGETNPMAALMRAPTVAQDVVNYRRALAERRLGQEDARLMIDASKASSTAASATAALYDEGYKRMLEAAKSNPDLIVKDDKGESKLDDEKVTEYQQMIDSLDPSDKDAGKKLFEVFATDPQQGRQLLRRMDTMYKIRERLRAAETGGLGRKTIPMTGATRVQTGESEWNDVTQRGYPFTSWVADTLIPELGGLGRSDAVIRVGEGDEQQTRRLSEVLRNKQGKEDVDVLRALGLHRKP